jgi:hypothetical protein
VLVVLRGMSAQLTFGLMSGIEQAAPYAEGDILVKHDHTRFVVTSVVRDADAKEPEVILAIRLDNGASCVLFPREVAYRST